MQHLRSLVNEINRSFAARIKETARLNGLVRQVKRQKDGTSEFQNIDNTGQPVSIDDRWNINLWHRLANIDGTELSGHGKGNKYLLSARMQMTVSAKSENIHDLLLMLLCMRRGVIYQGSDFEMDRIIRAETGKNDVNIDNSLFQIEYVITFQSDRCFDDCQAAELAPTGDTDCIEVSQGGVLSQS